MQIKIYVRNDCVFCEEALSFLLHKGVGFEKIDVTRNQAHFDEMLGQGGIATPFIIIGDRALHAFDRAKLEKLLEDAHE